MLSVRRRLFLALALTLCAAGAARAQTEQPKQEDNFVTQKMFANRVFDVRNRDPVSLSRVLAPLTSGFRGATVTPNAEFRTISVRDFPENIAVIEEAIRRLDMPQEPRPAIEFHVHMLVASNDESTGNQYPAELAPVVKQLQSSLGYKNFNLIGAQIVRGREGRVDNSNKGVADLKMASDTPAGKNPIYYSYNLRSVSIDRSGAQPRVQIEEFFMDLKVPLWLGGGKMVYQDVGFRNSVSMHEGERIVAGTTSIADKSVVVIVSAGTTR